MAKENNFRIQWKITGWINTNIVRYGPSILHTQRKDMAVLIMDIDWGFFFLMTKLISK